MKPAPPLAKQSGLYYKYRALYSHNKAPNRDTRDIFRKSALYYCAPLLMNDPFDCTLRVHCKRPTKRQWRKYCLYASKKYPTRCDYHTLLEQYDQIFSVPDFERQFLAHGDTLNRDKSSVLCLSTKKDSIPMYSYYADGHLGIALEFMITGTTVPCGLEFHHEDDNGHPYGGALAWGTVDYPKQFPVLDYLMMYQAPHQLIRSLIFTKHKDWKHEAEFRIYRRGIAPGHASFNNDQLKRVIFGRKADAAEFALVKKWLRGWTTPVILSRAVPSGADFRLIIQDFAEV